MSPGIKYTFGRVGLFVVCTGAAYLLLPAELDLLLKLLVGAVLSMVLSYLLLRKWRDEMATQLTTVAARRQEEKQRLHAALAGDPAPDADDPTETAEAAPPER